MNVIFTSEESILVEIHPHYRVDRHFRVASRMVGKVYMPLRTTTKVTCDGSSDNVIVDASKFKGVLDSAVRIARQFDDGVSECGLTCDESGVMELDEGRDEMYGVLGVKKERKINTRFPCG